MAPFVVSIVFIMSYLSMHNAQYEYRRYFNCNGDYTQDTFMNSPCYLREMNCVDHCILDYCVNDCTIECIGDWVCVGAIINGEGNGSVIVNCKGSNACYATYINCPKNKYCNITGNGWNALEDTTITGSIGSKLFINGTGYDEFGIGYQVMPGANIYCPTDYLPGTKYSNDAICDISVNSDWSLEYAHIYANEGFNNVRVMCENDYYVDHNAYLHCGAGKSLDKGCYLQSLTNSNELICDTNICNEIVLPSLNPSLSPTLEPTTSNPTFSPTKYNPYEEHIHILYVSNYGYDEGHCSKNLDFSPSPTFISTDCDSNNTWTINNNTRTFTRSVSGYYYGTAHPAIICIEVAAQTHCMNPTITVMFEQTDYHGFDYLSIGYKSKSNLINYYPCKGVQKMECSVFKECAVNNELLDDIWTHETSPYPFYFINSLNVAGWCRNPDGSHRNMGVKLSATCNSIPSTCKTIEYAFKCLFTNNTCLQSEYDGNGKIEMDYGYFNFNKTISIKNKQIKLAGIGPNNTILNHTSDNNIIISCHFRQCYLTIEELKYQTTTTTTALIKIINDGNVKFDNVQFEGK
eukprot:483337_1